MDQLRKWLLSEPRHGLEHWLLLIMAIPLAILYIPMNFSTPKPTYALPATFVWIAIAATRLAEVLPRNWKVGAAILRIVGLISGGFALLLLLWVAVMK